MDSVEQLELSKKGKAGRKPKTDDNAIRRTVRSDHGYPQITLPKFFLDLGLKLNSEVIIERRGEHTNPLNWEIVIKPVKTTLIKGSRDTTTR